MNKDYQAMRTLLAIVLLALSSSCVGVVSNAVVHDSGQAAQAAKAFEQLKALAGKWSGTSQMGPDRAPAEVTYEVVSANSTVMERLFPGTPHEMISMYHLDGGRLLMTHYCAQGNQPRMRLNGLSADPHATASFTFTDATNWKGPGELIMHDLRLTFLSKDHIIADWVAFKDGKADHSASFDFTRQP